MRSLSRHKIDDTYSTVGIVGTQKMLAEEEMDLHCAVLVDLFAKHSQMKAKAPLAGVRGPSDGLDLD